MSRWIGYVEENVVKDLSQSDQRTPLKLMLDYCLVGKTGNETHKSEHQDRSFLESEVFNGLRVWHISGMIIGAVMIIIISLCCLCKCRIPR